MAMRSSMQADSRPFQYENTPLTQLVACSSSHHGITKQRPSEKTNRAQIKPSQSSCSFRSRLPLILYTYTMARTLYSSSRSQIFKLYLLCIFISVASIWHASKTGVFDVTDLHYLDDEIRRLGRDSRTATTTLAGDAHFEQRALSLALSVANHSASDPWISLWRKVQGRTLSPPACLPRLDSEEDESRFLMRNSIYEVKRGHPSNSNDGNSMLCTVTNGFEFALRYRLDEVQHPRLGRRAFRDWEDISTKKERLSKTIHEDTSYKFSMDNGTESLHSDIAKWRSAVVAAKNASPSCQYAGPVSIAPTAGWGGQW